jgi:pentatricopeptide repeat protein
MWLEVEYIPTSLFSFKDINATNTAARSLLIPTPFAVKMALISVCIQRYNLEKAKELFELLKERDISFKLPRDIVVNKTFGRINDLREQVGRSKPGFREYVFYKGSLKVACDISNLKEEELSLLKSLFKSINYFGKKGSFMQFKGFQILQHLNENYLKLMGKDYYQAGKSIIQFTEDIPSGATFEDINIYDSNHRLKRDDNKRMYVVNLEEVLSGANYQYYKISYT